MNPFSDLGWVLWVVVMLVISGLTFRSADKADRLERMIDPTREDK